VSTSSSYHRQLTAAYRLVNGQFELIQPEPEDLANPGPDLWTFWLEQGFANAPGQRFIACEIWGIFIEREPAAERLEQTPFLAQILRQATVQPRQEVAA
jgi:hypothetical protein